VPPFKSDKQRKFLFKNKPKVAKKFAEEEKMAAHPNTHKPKPKKKKKMKKGKTSHK